jgi:hypothetical protein
MPKTAWRWLSATGSCPASDGAEPAAQAGAATAAGTVSGPGEDGEKTAADTGGTDVTQRSGVHPAAPAGRASQGLEVYGDSQYGSGEARAASGKITEILQRRPPRPRPDFRGLGSKDCRPGHGVAERGLPGRPRMRPGTMAGRPAGAAAFVLRLPGLACGGSWGAAVVQLVWRGGWRVGRGNGAAEPGGVGQVEPAGGHGRA